MKKSLQTLLTLGVLTTGAIYADGNIEVSLHQNSENSNPLSVTFHMTNSSDGLIKIFKSTIPFEGEVGKNIFEVRDGSSELRYTGRLIERFHEVNEENFLYLDAGESYETTVNLSTLYNFSRQNRAYEISFDTTLYVVYADDQKEQLSLHSNSLDIEASVNSRGIRKREQTYEASCSESQQNLLGQALSYAENIAVNSANILHTSDANSTQFKEWFGRGDYEAVTTNFDSIASALSKNIVNFDCGCQNSYVAYVYPYQPHTIYLCNGFWNTQMQGTDSKAGTIVHETSHFRVVASTSDHAYGQLEARSLARTSPSLAVNNADSHEYFAEPNLEAMIVAPTGLSVTGVTTTTAQLLWEDNADNERGFEIFEGVRKVGEVGADETSFDITGLEAGHSYAYLVRAIGAESTLSTTANISFTTDGTGSAIPTAPTDLTASSIRGTEAILTWSDTSDNEQGFRVYQGETLIDTVGANVTQYQLSDLSESTDYTYSIKAYNAQGASSAIEVSFQTAQPINLTTHPINLGDRVTGTLSQHSSSTHRVGRYAEFYTFTLEQDADITIDLESSYTDTYLYLLSGATRDAQIVAQDDDGGTRTNSQISQRLSAGTYTLEATTYRASQNGSFVLDIQENSVPVGTAPAKPIYIMPRTIKDTSTEIYWSNVENETGFKIYQNGVEIATVGADVTSYTVINLTPNTEYTFGVKAFNQHGVSSETSISFSTQKAQTGTTPITMNSTKNGQWVSTIASTHRAGRYAQYYTFTLAEETTVVIDLESSTDAFLYLLSGDGTNGSKLASDDDGGVYRNSKIIKRLEAGTYTIEATTYSSAQTGSFSVKLGQTDTASVTTKPISINQTENGQWSSSTLSIHRPSSYAQYYTFTLTETTSVTIDLESSEDAYLYLFGGNGMDGAVVSRNDDGGEGRNSRISSMLSAGTYTVEATTYRGAKSGSFSLRVGQ